PPGTYPLSLHDALPILVRSGRVRRRLHGELDRRPEVPERLRRRSEFEEPRRREAVELPSVRDRGGVVEPQRPANAVDDTSAIAKDRKSTRLNSSHVAIS